MNNNLKKYKKESLEILDIDELLEKEQIDDVNPLLPSQTQRHPTRMLMVGASGSGKTSMIINLICRFLKCEGLYILCKNMEQPKIQYLINFFKNLENKMSKKLKRDVVILKCVSNNVEDFCSVDDVEDGTRNNICLMDDVMLEKDPVNKIGNWFIRSRTKGVSVFYMAQSFFSVPRQVRLNCNTFVFFGMPSLTEARRIHSEVAGDITKEKFIDYLRQVDNTDYAFLYVDKNTKNKLLRYRKNLDEGFD